MIDLMTLLFVVFVAIGIVIYVVSRLDKRSGCFYTLLMALDAFVAGTVLLARFG